MANGEEQIYKQDPLFLHNSDHPGMILTTTKLNGMNFIPWSRSIKISLISKMKLGFINGACVKPDAGSPNLMQWERCDNMVFSWILNSIQPDLAEAFLYANSSQELWNELVERFGESNGPLLYQIEKKIADLRQNNEPVGTYFTKLKKLWDELNNISEPPICECNGCTCGAKKRAIEADQRRKLTKFLMGLNEGFDNARGQILLTEPLPSATKACSLVQQVERQRSMTGSQGLGIEMAAYANNETTDSQNVSLYVNKGNGQKQSNSNKFDPRRVRKLCDHCKETGHFKEQCFKLVGYPEWFKGPKGKKGQNSYGGNKFAANIVAQSQDTQSDTPFDDINSQRNEGYHYQSSPMFVQQVAQEMMRLMTDKTHSESGTLNAYAHLAGPFN